MIESWRKTWREGFAPAMPTLGLQCLQKAIEDDDPRLLQGTTTSPPPLMCVQDWPMEGADAVGFAYWQDGLDTVGEVEDAFARACYDADQRLGEPGACRYFLNWFDDTPRAEMRRDLLEEVKLALAGRVSPAAVAQEAL